MHWHQAAASRPVQMALSTATERDYEIKCAEQQQKRVDGWHLYIGAWTKTGLRLTLQRHGWVTTLIVYFQASTGLCDAQLSAIGSPRTRQTGGSAAGRGGGPAYLPSAFSLSSTSLDTIFSRMANSPCVVPSK